MYKVPREVYLNENLNEIKNWDLIKGHSKRANVIFSDSENQDTKTKQFALDLIHKTYPIYQSFISR